MQTVEFPYYHHPDWWSLLWLPIPGTIFNNPANHDILSEDSQEWTQGTKLLHGSCFTMQPASPTASSFVWLNPTLTQHQEYNHAQIWWVIAHHKMVEQQVPVWKATDNLQSDFPPNLFQQGQVGVQRISLRRIFLECICQCQLVFRPWNFTPNDFLEFVETNIRNPSKVGWPSQGWAFLLAPYAMHLLGIRPQASQHYVWKMNFSPLTSWLWRNTHSKETNPAPNNITWEAFPRKHKDAPDQSTWYLVANQMRV